MEGFTQDVVAYMKAHPEAVWQGMFSAIVICQKQPFDPFAAGAFERANAHIFEGDGCSLCQKLFLEFLRLERERGSASGGPSLSQYFALPREVAGFLEWSTGVLRINATLEQFQAYTARLPEGTIYGTHPDDEMIMTLVRAITHEQFHFRQAMATGYGYTLACAAFIRIMQEIGRLPLPHDWNGMLAAIAASPPLIPDLTARFAELDEEGPDGVTIRDVIESAALLYECKAHMPDLDHAKYSRYLDLAMVLPEYRRAYDLATEILGPVAFDNFLVAAVLALCFRRPDQALGNILQQMAGLLHLDAVYRSPDDFMGLASVVIAARRRYEYLGTAWHVLNGAIDNTPLVHPYYARPLQAYRSDHSDEQLLTTLVGPILDERARSLLAQPVLLNGDVIQLPAGFEALDPQPVVPEDADLDRQTPGEFVNTWAYNAVICQIVLAGTGHQLHYRIVPAR
jgi:hypothetical protein